jgi:hypothetical protein
MNEKIKTQILDAFVAMSAKVGDCIPERWISQKLIPSLNPKEQAEVNGTIDGMKNEGFITVHRRSNMLDIALGQAGYDAIYPSDPVAAKTKIRTAILEQF